MVEDNKFVKFGGCFGKRHVWIEIARLSMLQNFNCKARGLRLSRENLMLLLLTDVEIVNAESLRSEPSQAYHVTIVFILDNLIKTTMLAYCQVIGIFES